MSTLPAVPKVVRVDFHLSQGSATNIMIRQHFQYAGTLNTADATTWATAIATAFKTFINGAMVTSITGVYLELTDLSSNTAPQVVAPCVQTGSDVAKGVPAGVALVISAQIARRYRGGKPRTYLPGMSTSSLSTPSAWVSATVGVILGNWNTFITACCTTPGGTAIGAITHVNISYYSGFVNHTYPTGRVKAIPSLRITPLVDTITGTRGNLIPASQRRRNEQP